MSPEEYSRWVESIVDDLLDETTEKLWGPEARLLLALRLGLSDGDTMTLDEQGSVVMPMSMDLIDGAIARARAAKASGASMAEYFA